jgi:hypothetical protein
VVPLPMRIDHVRRAREPSAPRVVQ